MFLFLSMIVIHANQRKATWLCWACNHPACRVVLLSKECVQCLYPLILKEKTSRRQPPYASRHHYDVIIYSKDVHKLSVKLICFSLCKQTIHELNIYSCCTTTVTKQGSRCLSDIATTSARNACILKMHSATVGCNTCSW